MTTQTTFERWVTIQEVADYLIKPTSWMYNNMERLNIPRYKVGNHYRFRLSEVAAWVEGNAEG